MITLFASARVFFFAVSLVANNDIHKLMLTTRLNYALVCSKQEDYFGARAHCDVAIDLEPCNEKAHFRRGCASLQIGNAESALNDFKMVLELAPNNKAAQSQILACQEMLKKQLKKEKSIYANMFDKFAKMDTQVS